MPRSRERASDDSGGRPEQQQQQQSFNIEQSPLVIVSEQGRHSEASRRLVRAQAARASAAASRATRARNRERDGGYRNEIPLSPGVLSPPSQPTSRVSSPPSRSTTSQDASTESRQSSYGNAAQAGPVPRLPLVEWIFSVIANPAEVLEGGSSILSGAPATPKSTFSGIGSALSPAAITNTLQTPRMQSLPFGAEPGQNIQLPLALPKGFAALQRRLSLSEGFIMLVSRTACFDFASQGVEQRMHQLLLDVILTFTINTTTTVPSLPFHHPTASGHPIQSHIRIACASLTIYQGWRADGAFLTSEKAYKSGLDAAWLEVTMLDQNALSPLMEPHTAPASLWAVFIISVTTGASATAGLFHDLLRQLFEFLDLRRWEQVRGVLLDFIYPVSFLDQPCKEFWLKLCEMRVGLV